MGKIETAKGAQGVVTCANRGRGSDAAVDRSAGGAADESSSDTVARLKPTTNVTMLLCSFPLPATVSDLAHAPSPLPPSGIFLEQGPLRVLAGGVQHSGLQRPDELHLRARSRREVASDVSAGGGALCRVHPGLRSRGEVW